MKTKLTIGIAVVTAALFLLVPDAVSKKAAGSGLSLDPQCTSAGGAVDICTLTVTGLSNSLNYKLEVIDGCGIGGVVYSSFFSPAELAAGIAASIDDAGGCTGFSSLWTFNLYSSSGRNPVPALVGTGQASDSD